MYDDPWAGYNSDASRALSIAYDLEARVKNLEATVRALLSVIGQDPETARAIAQMKANILYPPPQEAGPPATPEIKYEELEHWLGGDKPKPCNYKTDWRGCNREAGHKGAHHDVASGIDWTGGNIYD